MGTGQVVLIVERDCHARELEAHFLREIGLRVELASDGASAWDKALRLRPDLLVTDILVPKLDGLALCRRIKTSRETKDVPVVVVSVLAASSRAREAGADGFLLKPISQDRLVAEATRLIAEEHA
jgi:CheY-like chemotaxis protein